MNLFVEYLLRLLAFVAAAATATFGVLLIAWPFIYWTAPVFIPFKGYERSVMDTATRFARHPVLWNAGYIVIVSAAAAALTLRKRTGTSILFWFVVVGVASVLTHLVLNELGYYFFMDTP